MKETSRPEFFESLYQANPDPWDFARSEYEQRRYAATIAALEHRHYRRAFEPGCSIGILTEMLAPRCDELIAIDVSDTAVQQAQRRCAHLPDVSVRVAGLQNGVPDGSFDLIVLSEIGYYFEEDALLHIANALASKLDRDGTFLAVHWTGHSPDHTLEGARVHQLLNEVRNLRAERIENHEGFLLGTWARS